LVSSSINSPKIKGSNPTGTGREKMGINMIHQVLDEFCGIDINSLMTLGFGPNVENIVIDLSPFSNNLLGGRKPTYPTSATSVLTSVKAVSVVPLGGDKTDVSRENTDVRWVGFHPLQFVGNNCQLVATKMNQGHPHSRAFLAHEVTFFVVKFHKSSLVKISQL
jgi:hypothetical protein